MTNCKRSPNKYIKCIPSNKCSGVYDNLDIFKNQSNKSTLNYSRFPYKCSPTANCLLNGVTLPNISKQSYNIHSNHYSGFSNNDYSSNIYEITNTCHMK